MLPMIPRRRRTQPDFPGANVVPLLKGPAPPPFPENYAEQAEFLTELTSTTVARFANLHSWKLRKDKLAGYVMRIGMLGMFDVLPVYWIVYRLNAFNAMQTMDSPPIKYPYCSYIFSDSAIREACETGEITTITKASAEFSLRLQRLRITSEAAKRLMGEYTRRISQDNWDNWEDRVRLAVEQTAQEQIRLDAEARKGRYVW